jgi:hypothetical protein
LRETGMFFALFIRTLLLVLISSLDQVPDFCEHGNEPTGASAMIRPYKFFYNKFRDFRDMKLSPLSI